MRFIQYLLLLVLPYFGSAQNVAHARKILSVLCSPEFHGRGYVNQGHLKAAIFVRREFKRAGLQSMSGEFYFQPFEISANTFPNKMQVVAGSKELQAGVDYLVAPISIGAKGRFQIVSFLPENYNDTAQFNHFFDTDHNQHFILVNPSAETNPDKKNLIQGMVDSNAFRARGIIELTDAKLVFAPSVWEANYTNIKVSKQSWPQQAKILRLDIDQEYQKTLNTQNVIGIIPGQIDSFVVFSAHYDHIGRMGENIYFPGAHDNASGTAMLIDLANHYGSLKKKPKYNMVFIAFGAEESGLLGSKYFTENPLFELSRIKQELNFDMLGSGDEGITVVNGIDFAKPYAQLEDINNKKHYLPDIKPRAHAAISDQHPFFLKGVNSLYIYTRGTYKEYHNIYDTAAGLPLNGYEGVFRLVTDFVQTIN
jgi:hypothetical protein